MTNFVDETLVASMESHLRSQFNIIPSNNDLVSWLSSTKQRLSAPIPTSTRILFVLGNEAADLDSCVSAISYAYLVHHSLTQPLLRSVAPKIVQDSLHAGDTEWIVAPVINIPEEDLALRSLFSRLCRLSGFDESHLLFAYSPLLHPFLSRDATPTTPTPAIVLVDHCIPCPAQQHLSSHVTAIIDHHADQDCAPEACPRLITPCASTTSLVALHAHMSLTTALLETLRAPVDATQRLHSDTQTTTASERANHRIHTILSAITHANASTQATASALATALLRAYLPSALTAAATPQLHAALKCGPHPLPVPRDAVDASGIPPLCLGDLLAATIAVDSVGMAPAAGKRTDIDERALKVLGWQEWAAMPSSNDAASPDVADESVIGMKRPQLAPMFALLSALLRDTAALTAAQCLRLDLKVAVEGGHKVLIPSLPRTMNEFSGDKAQELMDAIKADMDKQGADAVVLCCLGISDKGVERDVCVIGSGLLFKAIDSALTSNTLKLTPHSGSAQLAELGQQHGLTVAAYAQGDVKQSRKQIMPLVMQSMTL